MKRSRLPTILFNFVYLAILVTAVGASAAPPLQGLSRSQYRPYSTGEFGCTLQYAQSQDMWSTYSEINHSKEHLSSINQVFHKRFGATEEAFSRFQAHSDQISLTQEDSPFQRLTVMAGPEASVTGRIDNPVVPELNARAAAVGALGLGARGDFAKARLGTELTALGGYGIEKRIQGTSTDLIERIPKKEGEIGFLRLETVLTHNAAVHQRLKSRWMFADTLVRSQIERRDSPDEGALTHTVRWKIIEAYSIPLYSPGIGGFSLEPHFVAGPQPLPTEVLPAAWDLTHTVYVFPELGVMTGAGISLAKHWSQRHQLDLSAGFYGGYVGSGLQYRYRSLVATLGSWGVETSAAYQIAGVRIWMAGLGFRL